MPSPLPNARRPEEGTPGSRAAAAAPGGDVDVVPRQRPLGAEKIARGENTLRRRTTTASDRRRSARQRAARGPGPGLGPGQRAAWGPVRGRPGARWTRPGTRPEGGLGPGQRAAGCLPGRLLTCQEGPKRRADGHCRRLCSILHIGASSRRPVSTLLSAGTKRA